MHFTRIVRALFLVATVGLPSCGSPEITPLATETEPLPAATPDATPDCGKTNIATDEYGTDIHPTSGPPGTEVTFSGTTLRGEDWRWAPAHRLEAWWNTDVPASESPGGDPVRDGPVFKLVTVDDMERCRFETTFSVPDVEPGSYKISVFVWHDDGGGYFLPHHFTVTSEGASCDTTGATSYGKTVPGKWLAELFQDLGAPGGHAVEESQVLDTGTALQVDIPAYEDGATLYATMLGPAFPRERGLGSTARGDRPRWQLHLVPHQGDFAWESYSAVNDEWQLSLLAYPGAGNDEVSWPEGTVDWLKDGVEVAEQAPPTC